MRRSSMLALLSCVLFVPAALRALDQAAAAAAVTYPSVPEDVVPVEAISPMSADGHRGLGYLRTPPGPGPFPAVVIVHGGLVTLPAERVREFALGIQASRFLAAGYAVAAITYRSRDHDPQSPVSRTDTLAAVDFVRTRPFVDPDSVAVWGCSGGGDLGLEVAAATKVAAVVAEEPATILFTGVYDSSFPRKGDRYTPGDAASIYTDINRHYTAAHRKRTRAKIAAIDSPLLILQGDQQPLNRFNAAVFIPELRNAGKALEVITYAGEPHCFAFYGAGPRTPRPASALKAFEDSDRFIRSHLRTRPRRLESARIRAVLVSSADWGPPSEHPPSVTSHGYSSRWPQRSARFATKEHAIPAGHQRRPRKLKPVSMLTRMPFFDGTTATFTGTFSAPARKVMPPATASATPVGEMFGPKPNSAPSRVRSPTIQLRLGIATLCSSPPNSRIHSLTAANPLSFV